jgi:hypothetical protein
MKGALPWLAPWLVVPVQENFCSDMAALFQYLCPYHHQGQAVVLGRLSLSIGLWYKINTKKDGQPLMKQQRYLWQTRFDAHLS